MAANKNVYLRKQLITNCKYLPAVFSFSAVQLFLSQKLKTTSIFNFLLSLTTPSIAGTFQYNPRSKPENQPAPPRGPTNGKRENGKYWFLKRGKII
jgi:hypothetical protein